MGENAVIEKQSSNKLIDALFDENRDILILTSEKLKIIRINQSASLYFGISAKTLVGQSIEEVFDAHDRNRLAAITMIMGIDGETINTHFEVADYLGERHQHRTGIRFIQNEDPQETYFLFILRRARPVAAKLLSNIDSDQLIQRCLKSVSDSVLLIDMTNRTICDCNAAATSLFGYTREELIGRSPQFLAPDEDTAKSYVARGRESYARTGFYQEKLLCRKKDRSLFMTFATNLVLFSDSGEQKYVLAINKDITQEEKRFDDIVRLSEQSQQILRTLSESIQPLKTNLPIASLGSLGFSSRQIMIAAILLEGETTKAIAARMKVSESAIKSHLSAMYRRLGVSSRMEFTKHIHDRNIRIE
jgi:PAS domain S-box-containing protein